MTSPDLLRFHAAKSRDLVRAAKAAEIKYRKEKRGKC